jgi:hypothetical protein
MKRRSLRRFISFVVVLIMVFSGPLSGFAASGFTDTTGHWASTYISKAVSYGFVKGYLDGSFKPDNPVTRAEFCTMLNGALGVTNTTSINFSDVPSSEWYYTNVRKAVATGYTSGYLDNTFKPNGKITRQEAAVMISKIIPPYQGSASLASLGDNANIADWARAAATKVYAAGYIKGDTNNLYRPTASLSRAEAAAILTRLIEGETIVTADTNVSSTTTLRDRIYVNDLTINKALLDNDLTLNGCLILGNLYVNGGGNNTVTLTDTLARNMVVAKTTGDVRVLLTGYSTVNKASLTYGAKLEHSSLRGEGFKVIDLNGSSLSTQQVDLVGSFEQVNVNNASIINSASGTIANLNITSSASSDIVKLSGTYTNVTIEAKAYLELLSGRISNLTINSAAASSTVKMSSGTTVTRANVDGKTAFTGTGTISTMYANVNDITYETKPNTITKASSVTRPPTLSNDITAPSPTFTPIDGATGIAQNTAIKIVFDEAIYKSNGSSVTTSDIPNIIQIREDTSTGTSRTYSASISTDKKTITITPSAVLQTSQDYYIIILSGTIEDTLGNENAKVTSHFVTGTQDLAAPTVTFSPVSGTTNVAITTPIVLTFNETVYKYGGTVAITNNDFELSDTKDIVLLRTINSGLSTVPYSAVVSNSSKTLTISPSGILANNTTYYVTINTNKLRDFDGNVVPLTSSTFTSIALNSNNEITSFAFTSPAATGVITESSHTIAVTVPYGTALTSLTPTIVHNGASITSAGGIAKNFSTPVTYIVTATDATTQAYVVTVTVAALSSAKDITSFGFTTPTVSVSFVANNISVVVPYGTSSAALIATFTNSPLSNVKIGSTLQTSGVTSNNFGSSVTYTVTAEDATTANYTVTVIIADAPKAITSFNVSSLSATGSINESAGTILILVPFGTDVTNITPTIVHTGESVSPLSAATNNFASPVTYTVTGLDGKTKSYIVTVTPLLSSAKIITATTIGTLVSGNVTAVPVGTKVSELKAGLTVSVNASVEIIVSTGGIAVTDQANTDVLSSMVIKVTAHDSSIAEYTISL